MIQEKGAWRFHEWFCFVYLCLIIIKIYKNIPSLHFIHPLLETSFGNLLEFPSILLWYGFVCRYYTLLLLDSLSSVEIFEEITLFVRFIH